MHQNSCELDKSQVETGEYSWGRDIWPNLVYETRPTYHPRASIESSMDLFFISLHSIDSIASHLHTEMCQGMFAKLCELVQEAITQ